LYGKPYYNNNKKEIYLDKAEEFEALYRENYEKVYNLALGLTGNGEQAEEITQEAFFRALKSFNTFRHDSSFFTWIYRITLNVSSSYMKKKKSYPMQNLEKAVEKMGLQIEDIIDKNPESNPETSYLAKEVRYRCLHSLTECLSGEQRKIFCMAITLGLPQRTVAEILECSPGKVKTTLFRAKQKWFGYMNGRCNLMKKENPCNCEQWVRYFVENGLISERMTAVKLKEVNSRVLQEVKTLKSLQELYQTLYPDIADKVLAQRLRDGIKKEEWKIFS